jgi:hypothetical protein
MKTPPRSIPPSLLACVLALGVGACSKDAPSEPTGRPAASPDISTLAAPANDDFNNATRPVKK